jgi:hypothetical protein
MMEDNEREYLDSLTQLVHEHQHEETRQQIDDLFRRVNKPAAALPGFNLKNS